MARAERSGYGLKQLADEEKGSRGGSSIRC